MPSKLPLVLASGSPRRHSLLRSAGLEFSVRVSEVDEMPDPSWTPEQLVEILSTRKAREVVSLEILERGQDGPFVVLAADTIVVLDSQVLGKPSSREAAINMLSCLSGRQHQVLSGYAVVLVEQGREVASIVKHCVSQVQFRNLTQFEIQQYVDSGEPMDKAGAYGIQEIGSFLVEQVQGSYTNVVGLPLSQVLADLASVQ